MPIAKRKLADKTKDRCGIKTASVDFLYIEWYNVKKCKWVDIMSSSKIIAKRRRQVYMSHICSKCGFPTISLVLIESEASKGYMVMQSKAEKIASDTADEAIENEIKRINNCSKTKKVLEKRVYDNPSLGFDLFCKSCISEFDSPCSYCGNLESWQSETDAASKSINELEDCNFPNVFKDVNEAEQWAHNYILTLIKEIDKKREDSLVIEQAEKELIENLKFLQEEKYKLVSIAEYSVRDNLKKLLDENECLKNELGILDFKRRKSVGFEIKVLRLKLEDINKTIAEKEKVIVSEIKKLEDCALKKQAIAFGCSSDINVIQQKNVFTYLYKANDIPSEILLQLSNSTEKNKNNDICSDDKIVFCRKCGFKLIEDSAFCTKCGEKIK